MIKTFLLLCSILCCTVVVAQQTITVHFLYGSKPAKGYKNLEKKKLGGKKGGHVSIESGDSIVGFHPGGKCHVFSKNKKANGYFSNEQNANWVTDTVALKYTSIIIPLSQQQYAVLKNTINNYLTKSPYDYAVFGMRCAAAAYDILEETGIVKKRSRLGKWGAIFYPQLLRRRLLKIAGVKNYTVIRKKGKVSRNWEKE
jgi:hypothetical protein